VCVCVRVLCVRACVVCACVRVCVRVCACVQARIGALPHGAGLISARGMQRTGGTNRREPFEGAAKREWRFYSDMDELLELRAYLAASSHDRFRVWGLGPRVWGLEFGVAGLHWPGGFRV